MRTRSSHITLVCVHTYMLCILTWCAYLHGVHTYMVCILTWCAYLHAVPTHYWRPHAVTVTGFLSATVTIYTQHIYMLALHAKQFMKCTYLEVCTFSITSTSTNSLQHAQTNFNMHKLTSNMHKLTSTCTNSLQHVQTHFKHAQTHFKHAQT